MNLGLRYHYKNGITVVFNLIDNTKIFKKRRPGSYDNCVYRVFDPFGICRYYGEGKYYMGRSVEYNLKHMRPTTHKNDMLANTINVGWTIEILSIGLTKKEAQVLEALLIRNAIESGETLSKKGKYVWDGHSLINKEREWEAEKDINKYIDGNYARFVA